MITDQNATSPADELRDAAEKIRAIATATSHTGPWQADRWFVMTESGAIADADNHEDAAHIALMHPGVALALAKLLEHTADDMERGGAQWSCIPTEVWDILQEDHPEWTAAANLARAILGTSR